MLNADKSFGIDVVFDLSRDDVVHLDFDFVALAGYPVGVPAVALQGTFHLWGCEMFLRLFGIGQGGFELAVAFFSRPNPLVTAFVVKSA